MKLKNWLLELIYPRRAVCMGCGSMLGCDRDDICDECRSAMAKGWIGLRRVDRKSRLDGAAFAYPYRGAAGGVVRNLKYGSVWLLAEEMGRDVARAAQLLRIDGITAVTAVPMHPKRLKRRGHNHSELIARQASLVLDARYENLLLRTRNAVQQARLSTEERKKNLEGAFAVDPGHGDLVRGGTILLIDDVWTTGSTAASCCAALREAGAKKVYFAAYAYGERKKR